MSYVSSEQTYTETNIRVVLQNLVSVMRQVSVLTECTKTDANVETIFRHALLIV